MTVCRTETVQYVYVSCWPLCGLSEPCSGETGAFD